MSTSLLEFVKKGEWDAAVTFLNTLNRDETSTKDMVALKDNDGMDSLMHACFHGRSDVAHLLLQCHANVNSVVPSSKYTPLMFAVMSGSKSLVELLVDAGADVQLRNDKNRTAIDLAAFIGHSDCVKCCAQQCNRDLMT
eukprot:m.181294 g.181294  ORF g.181294 m.181294 type:complete len:139 (-) comp13585_c0_seq7:5611-6027(-)